MEREATTPKKNVYIVPDDGDRLMQPNEVCARLGTDNKFLKKLIILKLLKPVYFGKYARVAKTELNRFIEVHKGDDICRIVAIEEKKLKENKNEVEEIYDRDNDRSGRFYEFYVDGSRN